MKNESTTVAYATGSCPRATMLDTAHVRELMTISVPTGTTPDFGYTWITGTKPNRPKERWM